MRAKTDAVCNSTLLLGGLSNVPATTGTWGAVCGPEGKEIGWSLAASNGR
jgi:hypothetical protein